MPDLSSQERKCFSDYFEALLGLPTLTDWRLCAADAP